MIKKVTEALKFPEVFIHWILLLHEDIGTKLLLNFITDPINVTFSVRQRDPIVMLLFILYIELLLLRLQEMNGG